MANVLFEKNQIEIVVAPTCNHAPISFPYTSTDAPYDETQISVTSDSSWAKPSVNSNLNQIDVSFSMDSLTASYTATIEVKHDDSVSELFINAVVPPLDIYRLVDDPVRPVVYGIQRDGEDNGSIVAFNPYEESFTACLTVGKGPTDMVISDDASELFVINSAGQEIDIVDLDAFSIKENILLPVYSEASNSSTTANIDLGPNGVIYYTDGAWAPMLHVLRRNEKDVIQSTLFFDSYGFMDFAVTDDKSNMVAMPQYGWSAGVHTPKVGHLDINQDGTVSLVKQTTVSGFNREPFESPVLLRDDDEIAVMKTVSLDPADTDSLDRTFPSAIWSMVRNGSVIGTGDKLYAYDTGEELYTIPDGSNSGVGYTYTKAQVFTSDYTRFIYFNESKRTLGVVNIQEEIGLERMGIVFTPEDGAVVNSPESLSWSPLPEVGEYDVYLSADYDMTASADTSSPYYLGRFTGTSVSLSELLGNGGVYYWRVDPVTDSGPQGGTVYTFSVSEIGLDVAEVNVETVANDPDYQVDIQLSSEESGLPWSVSSPVPWITFGELSGETPGTLNVHLNASLLSPGIHSSFFTLTGETGGVEIPVEIEVEPLSVTHIRSDRTSEKIYAISEEDSDVTARAYLLEIDSASETVLRTLEVGSSVTDFAIHYSDDLIYVTNWKSGNLLVIDKNNFTFIKSIAFQPSGGTGYSSGDVYRVAAGVSERIIVEEEDQWIDLSLVDTNTENSLATEFVREGGGAFGPAGRYYYHGENNSSAAEIIKFDTSGDTFTQLAAVRPPAMSSYHGSRTVVVSEDGSRVFWAGTVLDKDLEPEWGIGETIYSTSTEGRFAFAEMAIYDINLRRQTLAMPASTTVSGYNSTTQKLVVQVGNKLKFYSLSSPASLPAPVLSVGNATYQSIDLSWSDESLEMEFVIQQRLQGDSSWYDVKSTEANVTSWTASGLSEGVTYEFRVRARTPDYSSPWSNVAVATSQVKPNQAPTAMDDSIWLADLSSGKRFSVVANDFDIDGFVQADSIMIVEEPQFGDVVVHSDGDVTYLPGDNFSLTDTFSYVVSDDDSEISSPAMVTVVFNPPPVLSIAEVTLDSIVLTWTDESEEYGYYLQIREEGDPTWYDLGYVPGEESGAILSGLAEGTRYAFRMRSSSSTSENLWSSTVSATTKGSGGAGKGAASKKGGGGAFLEPTSLFLMALALFLLRRKRVSV
jgi:hypothetical protein